MQGFKHWLGVPVKTKGDQGLVLLTVLVSLALASLTVWAVARQGHALQERDWADLRNAARAAADEQSIALQADMARALDAVAARLRSEGLAGVDRWLDEQQDWNFIVLCAEDQEVLLPQTPPTGRPTSTPAPELPRYEPDLDEDEVRSVLMACEPLLAAEDVSLRVRACLTAADCYRHLRDSASAVRVLESAGQSLSARTAAEPESFEALVEVIGCLAEAEAREPAREYLQALLQQIAGAHPARYTPEQLEFLKRRTIGIVDGSDVHDLRQQLEDAALRASIRRAAPDVLAAARAACRARPDSGEKSFTLQTISVQGATPQLMASRQSGADGCIVLAQSAMKALARYWPFNPAQHWRLARTPDPQDVILAQLDDSLGGAALVASQPTLRLMRGQARWRTALVLVTAAATAGAWGVVIWMMLRAMAHQRELVRLQRRFVADVSHELKTPLAMIRLLGETLLDGRVTDPQRVRAYHGTITREAERLSVLLDSILDFSRTESGRRQYVFEPCDFAAVARQAWVLFEPQFAAAGYEHHVEIEPNLPVVPADAAAVQQVIVNLLQNAFRYGGDGKYVRLAVNRDGYVIVVTVEDHGIGMTRSQLQRLGDTFFRAEDTRVRQTRGSGLGLAIVNHIVQAHGGKMEVHSRPNRGSKFTVWFPFKPSDVTANSRPA